MKKIIFYTGLCLLPIGQLLRAQEIDLGRYLLMLGLLILFIYLIAETIKRVVKGEATVNTIVLNILLLLSIITVLAKYFYKTFWDVPSLFIIPIFITYSLYYLRSRSIAGKSPQMKATVTVLIFFMIPLFAFTFTDFLGRYVPEWWFKRYSVDEGVTIDPPYGFKMEKTEKLSIQAFDLREAGQYEEAITVYKKALELEPQNPKLYFDISECYAYSNNLESAIASLDKAVELDSNFAPFFSNRGLLYYQLSRNKQAVKDYQSAIAIDSTEAVYYANLALALYDLKLTSEACENIQKAEALKLDISGSGKLKVIKNYCHQQNL